MRLADQVAGVLLLAFAAFSARQALRLPYTAAYGPAQGFFPFWLSLVLGVSALLLLVGSRRTPNTPWLPDESGLKQIGAILAATLGLILVTPLLGMVISTGLYMAAVLFYLEPRRRRANAIVAICTPIVVYFMFVVWLGVRLPRGILGI